MDETISRYFYELSEAKNERTTKRIIQMSVFVIAGLLTIILILSVMLYHEHSKLIDFMSEFEIAEECVTVEGGDSASYIGRDGSIVNGEDSSSKEDFTETDEQGSPQEEE